MDTQALLQKVRKIEIKTKGLTNQIFSGGYNSAFKGRGMSFSEVREYTYGDDVRNIDWNVTAKSNSPHVKVFEEERELTVMLLIDVSPSQNFGTAYGLKKEVVAEIAAILAFSAISNNDKVGAIFFTDQVEKYLPPKKGKKNILRIIREIIGLEPHGRGTSIQAAFQYLNNVQKKRSIVFCLSDFISDAYDTSVSITARKHDLIGINLYDLFEKELPTIGYVQVRDSESGQTRLLHTNHAGLKTQWEEHWQKRQYYLQDTFRKYGGEVVPIQISEDYVKSLVKFFKGRVKK